jgi:hypothetical protein
MVQPAGGSRSVLEAAMQGELPSCIPLLSPPSPPPPSHLPRPLPFSLCLSVRGLPPPATSRSRTVLLDLLFLFLLIGTRCAGFVISIIQSFPTWIVYFHSTPDVRVFGTLRSASSERDSPPKGIKKNEGGCAHNCYLIYGGEVVSNLSKSSLACLVAGQFVGRKITRAVQGVRPQDTN